MCIIYIFFFPKQIFPHFELCQGAVSSFSNGPAVGVNGGTEKNKGVGWFE